MRKLLAHSLIYSTVVMVGLIFAPRAHAQSQARWVDLNWTASTVAATDPNGNYNIYRVSGPCPTGTVLTGGVIVGNAVSTATTFRDSTVPQTITSPTTFCYAATFLGSDGIESVDSNLVPAVLPPNPTPPSNLGTKPH